MIIETIAIAALAVLLAFRMVKQRDFHIGRLWVMPAAVVIVAGFGLRGTSGSATSLAAIAAGLLAGAAFGYFRAETSIEHVDVAARSIATKPSVWFAMLFVATFVLKAVVRHGPLASVEEAVDFVMCLTAASICVQRLEFYRAFRRAAAG